jgi:hypothetical protein
VCGGVPESLSAALQTFLLEIQHESSEHLPPVILLERYLPTFPPPNKYEHEECPAYEDRLADELSVLPPAHQSIGLRLAEILDSICG